AAVKSGRFYAQTVSLLVAFTMKRNAFSRAIAYVHLPYPLITTQTARSEYTFYSTATSYGEEMTL
ncbi:hypothetical protein LTS09_018220, partial [Friedmanniomyces endolithicus]